MDIILFGITGLGNAVLEELIANKLKPKKIVTRVEKGPDPYLNCINISKIAKQNDIPVEYDKCFVLEKYDYCIVATYHKLINIDKSNFKHAFNIHPSLLPNLKGRDPLSEAIKKKLPYTGVTVHKLSRVYDEGEIYFQQKIKIDKYEKKNLIKKMMPVYKKMTNKLIKEFIFK
jgi:methionyl-tRNA formyltransferase